MMSWGWVGLGLARRVCVEGLRLRVRLRVRVVGSEGWGMGWNALYVCMCERVGCVGKGIE